MHTVLVAAAVLLERDRVLITQRKADAHLAGMWEFPGGKVEPGEDPRAALVRELREELGIETTVGEIVDVTFHTYEDAKHGKRSMLLLFFEATRTTSSPLPSAVDVAAFRWAESSDLDAAIFPPADLPVLHKVRGRLRAWGEPSERAENPRVSPE